MERLTGWELSTLDWLSENFPYATRFPMSPRHLLYWAWVDRLTPDISPPAHVAIWPRGGAKSSTAELGIVRTTVTAQRKYWLYVSDTQEQADKHVRSTGAFMERVGIRRGVNTYGHSKGWRRDELRTENGVSVSAFGMDTGARGVKLEEYRPDGIIFDDIDGRHDSKATKEKKVEIITQTVLPAGSSDVAVAFLQNKIYDGSIADDLATGKADFLHHREPVRVEPAAYNLAVKREKQPDDTYLWRVLGGTPTWAGQDLKIIEAQINLWGFQAFIREAQHEVRKRAGGLWSEEIINETRRTAFPPLKNIVVAIDPNTEEGGDAAGIIVAGSCRIVDKLHAFVLEDCTTTGGPSRWAIAAISAHNRWKANSIIAETNNGGEMIPLTLRAVEGGKNVMVRKVYASRGKETRAEPVVTLYEQGLVHHVGLFDALETELCTWRPAPSLPSPNRLDALVWAIYALLIQEKEFGLY